MFNRNIIGILGIAAAMMQDNTYIIDDEKGHTIFNRYAGKSGPNKLSKSSARIVKKSVPREGPKIGRNDKCTCGSGQKYKNCCLNKK